MTPTANRMREHAGHWERMFATDAAIACAEGLAALARGDRQDAVDRLDAAYGLWQLSRDVRPYDAAWAAASPLEQRLILVCLGAHFPEEAST